MWENLRHFTLGAALLTGSGVALAQAEPAPAAAPAETKGTINLQLEGVGADEAFDQLAKQAGVDLMVQDQQLWANADPIDLQVTNGYFWPTLIEMCNQARIRFNPHYGGDGGRMIMLERIQGQESAASNAPSSEYQGNIVRATYANRMSSVNYENPGNANAQFNIQFTILVDPALTTVGYTQVTVAEAIDDQGNSLVPPQRDGGMYGNQSALVSQANVNLLCPAKIGKKLTRLKGLVRTSAATKFELVEISNPLTAEPVKKETSEHEITIMPLKKTGQGDQKNYELKVTFRAKERQPGGLRRQQDMWGMMNRIEIRDADGKRFGNSGGGGGGGGDVVEYTLSIRNSGRSGQQLGEPAKLTWRIPTEVREVRIPFEFSDLVIPQN